jgi:hypothetical protein
MDSTTPPTQKSDNSGYGDNVPPVEQKKDAPPAEKKHDQYGYEIVPPVEEKKETPPTEEKKDPPKTDEPPKDETGYGEDEPPKQEEKKDAPPAEKKEEIPADEKAKAEKEVKDVIDTLGDGYDKDKISKFAIENNFTKAQAEAYVKMAKDEEAAGKKAAEEFKQSQRKVWKEELMSDADFGKGDKKLFDSNVAKVNKVLNNNLSNTKKVLTEKGTMLPPYLMRDLLALYKTLNPTTEFVGGEAGEPAQKPKSKYEILYPSE